MTVLLTLDHLAVLGATLDQATVACERALNVTLLPGGKHARFGTHNRLLGLEQGLYLEAIAIDPEADAPQDARWFGLDSFSGPARLNKWICRVDDMAETLRVFPEAGQPVRLTRGALEWTMAVPDSGGLPFDGMFPALIQWHSPVPPGDSLPTSDRQVDSLTVCHPQASALAARLGSALQDDRIAFVDRDEPELLATLSGGGDTWQL